MREKSNCSTTRANAVAITAAALLVDGEGTLRVAPRIGIGGSLAAPPLPHHRTYGSVYGGSVGCTHHAGAMRSTPSRSQNLFGRPMLSATLRLSRQGPWREPTVLLASSGSTPRLPSSATR